MKHIPNLLTALRVPLSLLLLALVPFSFSFFAVYLLAGLTDMADGFLARRLHVQTRLGARLDTVADLVFFSVTFAVLWPWLPRTGAACAALCAILLLKLATACLGFYKYRRLAFLHTYANKVAGLALFALPFLSVLAGMPSAYATVAAIALTAALEELLITIKSPDYAPDRKGLFE